MKFHWSFSLELFSELTGVFKPRINGSCYLLAYILPLSKFQWLNWPCVMNVSFKIGTTFHMISPNIIFTWLTVWSNWKECSTSLIRCCIVGHILASTVLHVNTWFTLFDVGHTVICPVHISPKRSYIDAFSSSNDCVSDIPRDRSPQRHPTSCFWNTLTSPWLTRRSKAPVTPGLRPGYHLPATEKCWNRGQIVERTYD